MPAKATSGLRRPHHTKAPGPAWLACDPVAHNCGPPSCRDWLLVLLRLLTLLPPSTRSIGVSAAGRDIACHCWPLLAGRCWSMLVHGSAANDQRGSCEPRC